MKILKNNITIAERRKTILYSWIVAIISLIVSAFFLGFGFSYQIKSIEIIGFLLIALAVIIHIIDVVMIFTLPNQKLDKKVYNFKMIWGFLSIFFFFWFSTLMFLIKSKKLLLN
ncbi:hypothetical protein [Mycoplasmoides pirum]|uniref:hypothetical protein n=1 Tax=Mycoplasmoides pirum TaxID=2122 RepID=UPI000485358C|nr:hypothetical protein [Mycoplasmoides pirum]